MPLKNLNAKQQSDGEAWGLIQRSPIANSAASIPELCQQPVL